MKFKINRLIFALISLLIFIIIFTIPINPTPQNTNQNILSIARSLITGQGFGTKAPPKTEIILVGDILLGRTIMTKSLDSNDFTYPVQQVKDKLNQADLVFANLENPFITGCKRDYDSTTFCAVPEMVETLSSANINVVSLANNHSNNYGKEGVRETVAILTSHNISVTGLGEVIIKNINDTRFGFLGFNFTVNKPTEEDYNLIKASKQKADVLIVGVHWGVEYEDFPHDYQKEWAQDLINAGADIVAGHHPHHVQTIDHINNKPVYYSLGNFIFDQMWSEKTRSGLAIKLTFEGDKLVGEEQMPTYTKTWSQPEFVEKKLAGKKELNKIIERTSLFPKMLSNQLQFLRKQLYQASVSNRQLLARHRL